MSFARRIVETLASRKETLAVAESCTGGLLSAAIVTVPGASRGFVEGIVAYANEAKERRLGVPREVLERFGAVSEETVRAMLGRLSTDARIAVSGIAGPDGGTPLKPVGTVVIGVAYRDKEHIVVHHFPGDRDAVRTAAVEKALEMLSYQIDVDGLSNSKISDC